MIKNELQSNYSNKKEGRQLDLASSPSVYDDDIFSFEFIQFLGVSFHAPKAAPPIRAIISISIWV